MGCAERYCALCGCPILQKSTILQLCKEKIYKNQKVYLEYLYNSKTNRRAIIIDVFEINDD